MVRVPQLTILARAASMSGKDSFMETAADLYEDAALIYTRLVRKESQEAAGAISLIHAAFGSHAALRAALIITIMKMEVQENHWVPGINLYAYLLAEYPGALPLTAYAMTCCSQSWTIPAVEIGGMG